ncbi:MAG TPA: zinc-dependent metalloprotease family protein, partial [Flavisolibacter sp.]|nr:zinc-dependent metalloprotease family protein [Flavisolibacter sp.]
GTERYTVVEAPVMHPDLAAKYPDIKSYAGKGLDDPASTIRFDISPLGFHAIILSSAKPTVYIDPVDKDDDYYMVVSRKDIIDFKNEFQCLTTDVRSGAEPYGKSTITLRNADDGKLRTYRLALCASGEYSQYWLNGTETSDAERIAKVVAAQNNHMTRANAIFERDFGVRLVLVANNDAVIYLNASTDPWNSNNLNSATQTTCDTKIGSANYDIGHLVHRASNNGNAGCIACVCKAGSKGSGFTSYSNLSDNENFVVDYLTHEMGHQLGANHTFTFSNEGTIAQVEPGSGSTIMGYAGITGSTTDVQSHSDDYFHAISIEQVTNYIKASTCAAVTTISNNIPAVSAGADYTIPRSTPFALTGTASDADPGDVLTYCWEQNDPRGTGFSTVPSATATSGPQFRSYKPILTLSRTFPQISSILSGTNSNKWEVLPSVARTLHFRFTARDNHSGSGANESDDMILTVSGTAGPFAVTAPNTSVNWSAGTAQAVTWSVNGTNGSPVNCANVAILLSTDGGVTFPTVLAASTPNDGSETITVPNITSTACRIKVAAIGNIFFDISNANFTIGNAPSGCANPTAPNTTAITANSAILSWTGATGADSYDVEYKQSSSTSWLPVVTSTTATSASLSGLQASTSYDWRVRTNCVASTSNFVSVTFTTSGITGSCPSTYDGESNNTLSGASAIPLNTEIKGTINVRGDNDYYRFTTSGGIIAISLTTLPANYNLSLYNSSASQIGISQKNGTADENITTNVAAGTYYARVYPKANANSASSCYTLKVTGTALKGEEYVVGLDARLQVALFPNPARNVLNVVLDHSDATTELSIFDIFGRLVMQQKTTLAATTLNIAKLSSGVYLLRASKNDKEISSIKFVKE